MSFEQPRPDARAVSPGAAKRDARAISDALHALLSPVVARVGVDLEDVTVAVVGRRSIVRAVVDRDGGIDLDVVAEVSRAISAALDDESADALIDGAYQLEVSSPGVDRVLSEPRHWRRALDRLVVVKASDAVVTGRVLSADTAGVVLSVNGRSLTVPWSELGPGRVQIEFNRDSGSDGQAAARIGEG